MAFFVKIPILQADAQDLCDGSFLAFSAARPGWTFFDTFTAAGTFCLVCIDPAAQQGNSLCGTARDAMQAMGALLAVPENLYLRKLAFRISAPAAAERTALEENRRADARPVIDAEFLDVENNAGKVRIFRHDYPPIFFF